MVTPPHGMDLMIGFCLFIVVTSIGGVILNDFATNNINKIIAQCGTDYYDCQSHINCCGNIHYNEEAMACERLAYDSCPFKSNNTDTFRECVCGL